MPKPPHLPLDCCRQGSVVPYSIVEGLGAWYSEYQLQRQDEWLHVLTDAQVGAKPGVWWGGRASCSCAWGSAGRCAQGDAGGLWGLACNPCTPTLG